MSTFSKITRHPQSGKYENARWIDDYFAPHVYGVRFPSDDKTYTVEMVQKAVLPEMWTQDVLDGMVMYARDIDPEGDHYSIACELLGYVQKAYKQRWERDKTGGEGAVEYYATKFKETNTSKRVINK